MHLQPGGRQREREALSNPENRISLHPFLATAPQSFAFLPPPSRHYIMRDELRPSRFPALTGAPGNKFGLRPSLGEIVSGVIDLSVL